MKIFFYLIVFVIAANFQFCAEKSADQSTPQKENGDGGSGVDGGSSTNGTATPQKICGTTSLPGLIIDDINDCDDAVTADQGISGYWYAYNGTCEGMTGEQVPLPSCQGNPPFVMEQVDLCNCRASTSGGGFPNSESEGWGYALIAIQFNAPVNGCAYGGIGLTTGGTSVRVKVATPATEGDSDHYSAAVSEGTHTLGWDDFNQEGWGVSADFNCSQITGILFQASNPTQFAFTVDDVRFIDVGEAETQREIPEGRKPGDFINEYQNTYYWFTVENDFQGEAATVLVDENCAPLVTVNTAFANEVCMEGSGRLSDGRIINLTGTCDCGHPCGENQDKTCFFLPDSTAFPWGVGSNDNPLEPLVSWAVNDLPYGTVVYAPSWDGVEIPEVDGLGGITHDGCFRVDDEGYSFEGRLGDFFAGTKSMFNVLDGLVPTHSGLDVYMSAEHCVHLHMP